ncbi:MAG TPA: HD domain-containing protein [Myxococcales bacterium]|jgi:hypothetical protein
MGFKKWLRVPLLPFVAAVALVSLALRPRVRRVTLPLALLGAGLAVWDATRAPVAPGDELPPNEVDGLWQLARARLLPGGPNLAHVERLYGYATAFSQAHGARLPVVRAAVILHDITKEKGEPDDKRRFCGHGEDGAKLAADALDAMGKSKEFSAAVGSAIREHMGPLGTDWRSFRKRFVARACPGWDYPTPSTRESEVLYDIDMLDLMTVDGILKVVKLRQADQSLHETIRQSALDGVESAWRSVVEAGQTLRTSGGRDCGEALRSHSKAFLDAVDWEWAKDLATFEAALGRYKQLRPLPSCLAPSP